MSALCRSCLAEFSAMDGAKEARAARTGDCPACGASALLHHPELHTLAIAHMDCDAFYASVEKRDRPDLRDRPVIVGGGRRGVVTTACYIARMAGVRSAMPIFKALKACPDATVIRPDMAKYRRVGRRIRAFMLEATPLVEPLSIDEAFLDLSGTEALHGGAPARTLAALARRIEAAEGISVSIGLSYNKFLAKVASDLDKPRGFAVIGRTEAGEFLAARPARTIWGVGRALGQALARDGIATIADLRGHDERALVARYGAMGHRLYCFARGQDDRRVEPDAPAKSMSAETTFDDDVADPATLSRRLWPLCETVAGRLKRADLAGRAVVLKLKTADFRSITRSRRLDDPTRLAEVLYQAARPLIEREANGRRFRLIGIGLGDLTDGGQADPPSPLDPERQHMAQVEGAIDAVRAKLGDSAIAKGRALNKAQHPADGRASRLASSARNAKSP